MTPRIRVLLITADLSGGGAERQFSLLASNLSRERFDLHLSFWRPNFAYAPPDDLPVHMIRKHQPHHVLGAIRDTRRLIERLRPEVIYTQLHYVNMVTGTALASSRHEGGWVSRQVNDPRAEMKGLFAVWARWALRRADCVVSCSQGVRRAVIDHLGLEPRRVRTIDNMADVATIDRLADGPLPIVRSPETFVVVHAGRLHPQKNQRLLLEAFSRLRGTNTELWMLGEGPLEGRLRKQAARLGISGQVRWLGFQENPFPFLRAADCLALSSDYEGLPNVIIESMICGTPPLATRCPFGPEELITDGVNGRLVPAGDADALASALQHLAHRREDTVRLGQPARQQAITRFDCHTSIAAYEQLFSSLALRPWSENTQVPRGALHDR